jgi:hypothetical protein
MAFQIVQNVDGEFITTSPLDVFAWAEVAGFAFVKLESRPGLRAELIGQPKFKGLVGPCWGGLNKAGEPVIRYEDARSCEILSA